MFAFDSSSKVGEGNKVEKSRADRRIDGDFKSSSVEMPMMSLIRKGEMQISKKRNARVVSVFSKEEEGYIMSKKRSNPTFYSTPAGIVAKRKLSTYGQNELQRRGAYHTSVDTEEEATPVFRQLEIASPQHSNRAVMKNSLLFPASDLFFSDHVSSTDDTSMHTHNLASKEIFKQIVENLRGRRSYSENKETPDSVSIIGKHSRGAVWKKVKASVLRNLNRLDRNKLEKIASKFGIEMIHVDSTTTSGALIERVREWITIDMDRYFSESIMIPWIQRPESWP